MSFEGWFYTLPLRLRSLFGRKQLDQELKDELRDHLEVQIEENLAKGMSPEEARSLGVTRPGWCDPDRRAVPRHEGCKHH